jgi:hypothetical protein
MNPFHIISAISSLILIYRICPCPDFADEFLGIHIYHLWRPTCPARLSYSLKLIIFDEEKNKRWEIQARVMLCKALESSVAPLYEETTNLVK